MAKVNFRFLEANVADENIDVFIKNLEGVLKRFAGEAYHFRYNVEKFANGGSSKPKGNNRETYNGGRDRF